MRIGVLASGNLGLHCLKECSFLQPSFIATDKNSEGIIEYAKSNNIPFFVGNPRNKKLSGFIGSNKLDVLFSINYLFLIEEDLIIATRFPINFHGSLLPKYRGRTPHVWAIINNEEITGITAHIIDQNCDTGDIILQKIIKIEANDSGADILHKFQEIYPILIKEVLELIKKDVIIPKIQDSRYASFFGKRTPDDGLIIWSWQKERIRNWIRAQRLPYPGAYTFLENEKVIIDEIKYTNFGFDYKMPNGLIIQDKPAILVKTPNGVIELTDIRSNKHLCKQGKIFKYEN